MKASVVDLRYKMNDVLKALDKNEEVTVLYHGKVKGILKPIINKSSLRMSEHSFFGMNFTIEISVEEEMENIRGGRFNAL